ncbi:hypothetical protein [Halioglobus sp. HI00S01]|uniref:hypothetical protein n=1 Tax=Halioglobus sp. HI00S01 TaxID=1822214 RepID=UPI0012E7BCD3|nr:hypothetical protein [Halioglobus sp. HI00S01]
MAKLTVAVCKDFISAKGHFGAGAILFGGRLLGKFVTHGYRSGNGKLARTATLVV